MISALIVLAMGVTSLVVAKLVQSRLSMDSDLRRSNYGGMLAQYTAESGINVLLYAWNTKQVPFGFRPLTYPVFAPLVATYSIPGGGTYTATSVSTYSISTSSAGVNAYNVVADATVTSAGASAQWQTITRRVSVTVATGTTQFVVTRYNR